MRLLYFGKYDSSKEFFPIQQDSRSLTDYLAAFTRVYKELNYANDCCHKENTGTEKATCSSSFLRRITHRG